MTTHREEDCLIGDALLFARSLPMGDWGEKREVIEQVVILLDRLATALESAATDAARIDWLEAQGDAIETRLHQIADGPHEAWTIVFHGNGFNSESGYTLRETIDAARASAAVPGEAAEGR